MLTGIEYEAGAATSIERRRLFDDVMQRRYAMLTTGGGLGLFVTERRYLSRCPAGWVFLPIEDLEESSREDAMSLFSACLDQGNSVRTHWQKRISD